MLRRFQLGLATSLALFACCVMTTGCGDTKNTDDDGPIVPSKRKVTSGGGPAKVTMTPIKATEYGTIKGKVKWVGKQPDINATIEALTMPNAQDKEYCLKGKAYETTQQAYRIGENGNLGNVFVWIEPAEPGKYFEIPEDQLKKFDKTEVHINQPHCAFMPHCTVVFSYYIKDGKETETGQKLFINNDAMVPHNSKMDGRRTSFNETIPVGGKVTREPRPEGEVIPLSCSIHPWMRAYVRSMNHPYAAVSRVGADLKAKVYENRKAADFGTYEITGVPVGAKVRLKAWHEGVGWLTDPKGEEITLGKAQEKDFEAKLKE